MGSLALVLDSQSRQRIVRLRTFSDYSATVACSTNDFISLRQAGTLYTDNVKLSHLSDEAHFWLNGYVNKQNCGIWSEANPQVYVETPLHPEKLTVWCALWAGGILLQKR
ncbi:hypothetical protein TNCV_589281 [Trichonephila clavipes]|nr:hypothetical protein TNCV_589281 [Trichonephila clavipes]